MSRRWSVAIVAGACAWQAPGCEPFGASGSSDDAGSPSPPDSSVAAVDAGAGECGSIVVHADDFNRDSSPALGWDEVEGLVELDPSTRGLRTTAAVDQAALITKVIGKQRCVSLRYRMKMVTLPSNFRVLAAAVLREVNGTRHVIGFRTDDGATDKVFVTYSAPYPDGGTSGFQALTPTLAKTTAFTEVQLTIDLRKPCTAAEPCRFTMRHAGGEHSHDVIAAFGIGIESVEVTLGLLNGGGQMTEVLFDDVAVTAE